MQDPRSYGETFYLCEVRAPGDEVVLWHGRAEALSEAWPAIVGLDEAVAALRTGESFREVTTFRGPRRLRREVCERGARYRIDIVADDGEVDTVGRTRKVDEARRIALGLSREHRFRIDVGYGVGLRGFFERYRGGKLVEKLRAGKIEKV